MFTNAAETIDAAEFDTVFIVTPQGEIAESAEYTPEVYWDDETQTVDIMGEWTAVEGLTGQHGYNGPIMHESEYFSAGCLDFIMQDRTAPLMVALTTVSDPETGDPFGWVILTREA